MARTKYSKTSEQRRFNEFRQCYGLTNRQAMFCYEYSVDLNGTRAAIAAGYSEKTATVIAAENLTKPYVREAVDFLLSQKRDEIRISRDMLIQQFQEDRALAHRLGQAGAAVSSSMNLAKLLGHLIEKKEITGKDGEKLHEGQTILYIPDNGRDSLEAPPVAAQPLTQPRPQACAVEQPTQPEPPKLPEQGAAEKAGETPKARPKIVLPPLHLDSDDLADFELYGPGGLLNVTH